jgi:hypothetical protein
MAWWHIELDDGSGADRSIRVDETEPPTIGSLFYDDGREWIVDRVEADRRYAHAVPAE